MELVNDFLDIEPPRAYAEWTLEERASAAASFWGAISIELDNSLIRDFGMERWCDYTTAVLASHQRQFFVTGVEKLGIPRGESDAIKSALYHSISNALGGLRMKHSIESPEKAWIFYYPQTMGTGTALLPDEYILSVFRGWHVHNGEALGNDGLVFVATHLQSRGDPCDAGYFLDTGEAVAPTERLRVQLGEPAPEEGERRSPEVDDDEWPDDRRLKARRNFAVEWAWDGIASAVEHFGEEGLGSVRHACEAVAFSFLPYYANAIPANGVAAAAGYFAAVHEICGWNVEATEANGETTIALDRDPIRRALESLPPGTVANIYGAITRAWAHPAAEFGAEISLTSAAGDPSWRFSPKPR
jgi:hypothetical protein